MQEDMGREIYSIGSGGHGFESCIAQTKATGICKGEMSVCHQGEGLTIFG